MQGEHTIIDRIIVFLLKIIISPIIIFVIIPLDLLDRLSIIGTTKRIIKFYNF